MMEQHLQEVEEQAALFALGALPADEAARFEQRVSSGCPVCRAHLREHESVARLLPWSSPARKAPAQLRSRLLESLGAAPAPDSEAIIVRAGETEWVQTPVPGVQTRALHGKRTMLVRMAPKTVLPAHDHAAAEQCLVLEGSVTSDGVSAFAGDYTYMPAGSHHSPLYSEEGCLLLIAYT